jgi:starch synthase
VEDIMRIAFISSEVHPFSKSGGLADVASSLPIALAKMGHEVVVVSPWYKTLKNTTPYYLWELDAPRLSTRMGVADTLAHGVRWVFVGGSLFDRDEYYGYSDDAYRFIQFCLAVPHVLHGLHFFPDAYHLNDWQTGLIAPLLRYGDVPDAQRRARSVLTIHNLAFHGRWGLRDVLEWSGLPRWTGEMGGLEYNGDANLLKAGIVYSDVVSTVSPRYAFEVTTPEGGFGLDGALRGRGVRGILNGIDTDYWNPATDKYLTNHFSDLAGKEAARVALCHELNLDPNRPTLAMVSRLSEQKGLSVMFGALESMAKDWNIVVLGSGDLGAEQGLTWFMQTRQNVHFQSGFNEPLAHRIYAGADAFLMPSLFEPCGLSQMIAMRYGTLPIVRAVGGLLDTVPEHKGYPFWEYAYWALEATARHARSQWRTPEWERKVQNAMQTDFSWGTAARDYLGLYGG